MAWGYRRLKEEDKARILYRYVATQWPNKDRAVIALRGVALCSLALNDQAGAEAALEAILTRYGQDKDVVEAVSNIATEYRDRKDFIRSRKLHQYILDKYPQSELAIWSCRDVILCSRELNDDPNTQAGIDRLLSRFGSHKDLALAIRQVGRELNRKGDRRALELLRYNAEHIQDNPEALQSGVEAIYTSLHAADVNTADATWERLLKGFSRQATFARQAYHVAGAYARAGSTDKAGEIYRYVVGQWPQGLWAKASTAQVAILQGQDATVQGHLDKLIGEFKGHPDLPMALFQVGEYYWAKAIAEQKEGRKDRADENFKKALVVWETIIKDLPSSIITAQAYHVAAETYRRFGQDEKAMQYYQKIVDTWPDYNYAWLAQHRIAKLYKGLLARPEVVADTQAKAKAEAAMKAAYKRLLDTFPNSPAAPAARTTLEYYGNPSVEGGHQ